VSRRRKIIAGVALVAVVAAVATYTQTGGSTATKSNEVIILNKVQRRTLQSTVALTGTFARRQLRNITAATQGLVSAVYAKDGGTARAGKAMFALNGRDAIAETGTVPFFRSLAPGDEGDDVLQLKQILAAAGDDPGPMTPLFTEQTQFALAQWQAQNHYPNSTPASPQSVTVALQQGTGYMLGDQVSAGLIIGPPAAQTTASTSGAATHDILTASQSDIDPSPPPVLTVQSVNDEVSQGMLANFVISATAASASDTTVNLSFGGTAGSEDIVTPPSSVVLTAGATSATVSVQTRVNNVVEQAPTVVLSIAVGSGYSVGTPGSAETTIQNDNVPSLQITGGTTVSPGGTDTLTVTSDQAPLQNTQVDLSVSGSAVPGTDYDPVDPVLTLTAGSTSASVTIDTLNDQLIQPDKYIVVSIAPSPTSYSVGPEGSAVITINGSGALPTVTLSSATTYLQKGEPYEVTVSLNEALGTSLPIALAYGGSAVSGTDYTVPGGILAVPAGQTTMEVTIPTVTDNTVELNRTLTVTLAASPGYRIGAQNSVSVTISSSVVPVLDISVNTSTVAQGGAASFVITAEQPVAKNTSVNFAVEGTAQPGQDYEPLVGAALLQAGQSQVTVVLQSLRTDVTFEPTDMIVGHWPTRVGQVFVKAGAPIMPGGAILSLTQPDLTVTLQASAANRTLLRVGQSCTVQIAGSETTASGTITELDSTPTNISAGTPGGASQQVYEGRIEVSGLSGADGSAVSITVVDQQVDNALTVPIAAVKQNGVGANVVRVIDRKSGTVTEVPVTTGLTEGSYIQITKGVHFGQTVIVEVDQAQ
jgi:multidrug efflux pump subunit AcrA (membrane-fusion protein)